MTEIPIAKRFEVLCRIDRAQHFAWRDAVQELFPEVDPATVVHKMWEVSGRYTAAAYLKRLDPSRALPAQVARSVAWSSSCMGEDVEVIEDDAECRLVHHACPWVDWHREKDLLAEDRPGCDRWFATIVSEINAALDAELRFETLEALPDGDPRCLRRFWTEPQGRS
jgi:hypothetical protein